MQYYGIDILMPSVKDNLDKIREYAGIEAESAAADAVRKYDDKIALVIAHELADAAQSLKDKNVVVQIAQILSSDEIIKIVSSDEIIKILSTYEGTVAAVIAQALADAARSLRDKDAVVQIAQVVSRYEGDTAKGIAWYLANAARFLKDKDAVVQIAHVVSRYDGAAAEGVAEGLAYAARSQDKDAVVQIAQILSSDEIIEVVSKYEGAAAKGIAWTLAEAARSLRDKDAVVQIAHVVSRYDGAAAEGIAEGLAYAARSQDKDAVIQIAQILSSDEIIKVVSRYDGTAAEGVAEGLAYAARYLKNKDAVIQIAHVVSRYEGAAAEEVAWALAEAARYLEDADMMTKYITMLDTVNKFGMADKIDPTSGAKIVKEELDVLVTDKNSLWSCLAYVDSGCKFPKPTNRNIGSYKSIVNDFVKSEYGINVQLNLDQISAIPSLFTVSSIVIYFVIMPASLRDSAATYRSHAISSAAAPSYLLTTCAICITASLSLRYSAAADRSHAIPFAAAPTCLLTALTISSEDSICAICITASLSLRDCATDASPCATSSATLPSNFPAASAAADSALIPVYSLILSR